MHELAENLLCGAFFLTGLAFFIFMINFVNNAQERKHERDLQRDREFGVQGPRPLLSLSRRSRRR